MARPKKKAADRRGKILAIRLTDLERKDMETAARAKDFDALSDWARDVLLRSACNTKGVRR